MVAVGRQLLARQVQVRHVRHPQREDPAPAEGGVTSREGIVAHLECGVSCALGRGAVRLGN